MPDSRTVTQLEAEHYHHICAECCKGSVWMPFNLMRKRVRGLDAMTVDQIGARLRCDRCGNRPERYYPVRQEDSPGYVKQFSYPKYGTT
jgi:hypothetical protein